jgi:prepilin signal peptidase PulO-like enzyme (type II secretory pathway)
MIIFIDKKYWFGYGLFISAGMVTIRTDFEKMLISRYVTWGLMPIAFILSYNALIPLTFIESIGGAAFGYLVLWIIAYLFYAIRNIEGMGEGYIDLLGMIGSFIGITGAWTSLLIGSLLGIIACLVQMAISKRAHPKIAFGPWLAIGSFIYLFLQQNIQEYIQPLI